MPPLPLLGQVIIDALGHPLFLSAAIVIGVLILEDPTIVLVGVLASDGAISVPLALGSLYVGVILGDIVFFSIGRYASTHPRFARYVDHDYVVPVRAWLETRYALTIFSARFIPGSRLPTYAASGFIGKSFSTFLATVVLATAVWTTLLFALCYWFGSITAEWLHQERWIIAAVFIVLLVGAGHLNVFGKKIKNGFLTDSREP
jgi:membrane protein DedA with SNARE-associated domain